MADLGVQPHIIEAVLNHVSGHKGGVAGIYNRSSYEREVRAALMLWADHVRALVEGGEAKVLAFRPRRKNPHAAQPSDQCLCEVSRLQQALRGGINGSGKKIPPAPRSFWSLSTPRPVEIYLRNQSLIVQAERIRREVR